MHLHIFKTILWYFPIDPNRIKVYEDRELFNLTVSFLNLFELSFVLYKSNNASVHSYCEV